MSLLCIAFSLCILPALAVPEHQLPVLVHLIQCAANGKRERNIFWKGRKIDVAEISVKFSEYRACVVKGKNALFHRWADKAQTVENHRCVADILPAKSGLWLES